MNKRYKGRSLQPSTQKRRSKIEKKSGVAIKIKAPRDSKFEGSPSKLFTPTPIQPQITAIKLNIATFLKVFDLVFILLIFKNYYLLAFQL